MKLKKIALAVSLALASLTANSAVTDGAFSANQIFDVQYYWSGNTLNASNFIAPFDSSFQTVTTTAGQYFKFIDNNDGTYGLGLYNSDNNLARVIHNTGQITALGNGAIFYIGSGFFGNVISTAEGFSYGDSATFTNMDTSVTSSDLSSYTWASTTPLASGQTASSSGSGGSSPAPNYVTVLSNTNITTVQPTSNNSPANEGAAKALDGNPSTKYLNFDRANAGFTIKLNTPRVIRGVTFTTANDFEPRDPTRYSLFASNDGITWTTIVDNAPITLSSSRFTTTNRYDITNNDAYFYYFITFPSIKAIDTYGSVSGCQAALGTLACDSVQIGDVTYYYDTTYTTYTVPTDPGTVAIANPGTPGSTSSMSPSGPQAVIIANGSSGTNNTGTTVLTVTNNGTYINNGTSGDVTNTGTFTNTSTTGNVNNSGNFTNNGTTDNVTNSGTFTNNGTTGTVDNSGTFTNNASGVTGNVTNSGTFTNAGTTGTVTNNLGGTFTNSGTVTTITNLGTFTNNGTGGVWTNGFNGDGNTATFTNTGTLGNGTNYSTFTNTGGTMGTVSNVGTFNNAGTTGAVTNTGVFNNNAGGTVSELAYNNHVVNNAGTINSITYNGGTVDNTGTIDSINNTEAHGTFHNTGTVTGTVTTNSTFNNNVGGTVTGLYTNNGNLNNAGTVNGVINNNTFSNTGTAGNVSNNGTFNNSGTVGVVTLISGSFDNTGTASSVDNTAGLTFTNAGTITGLLANTGSVTNTGNVGSLVNTGTYSNSGTTGNWINSSIIVNSGTMNNGTNSGTFTNTGIVGNVTNTGTFVTSNTAGTITNSGIVSMSGGNASISNSGMFIHSGGTLGTYTQDAAGTTKLTMNTSMPVTGNATLGGRLVINNAPTAFGRYSLITAGSLTGAYNSFASAGVNDYLKYSNTGVQLYVTPSSAGTQSSINTVASNLSSMTGLQNSIVTGALGSDCNVFSNTGACVSFNTGASKAASGDIYTGGLTIAKKVNDNWRFGFFTNSFVNDSNIGNVSMTSNPAAGGFVSFVKDKLSITASAASSKGTMTISRTGPESGLGKSNVDNTAYQVKVNYSIPVNNTVVITPYAGIRNSKTNLSGFVETGPVFPLTVESMTRSTTDALVGISLSKQISDRLTTSIAVGAIHNINKKSLEFKGTSEIGGLSTFNGALPSAGKTRASMSLGATYSINKTTSVSASLGWQQKGANADINSISIGIVKGF